MSYPILLDLLIFSRDAYTPLRCQLLLVPLRRQLLALRAVAPPAAAVPPLVVGAVATSVYVARELLPTKILTTITRYPLTPPLRYVVVLIPSFLIIRLRFAYAV